MGFGTRYGGGCTSGHAITGLSTLQLPSLVATVSFFAGGILSANFLLHQGQVVVMDNLSSHHRASIRTLLEDQGCELLFTSPYSPDFNPIELMFSKLKALFRGGARRVVAELHNAIRVALGAVSDIDIQHWFRHTYPKALL